MTDPIRPASLGRLAAGARTRAGTAARRVAAPDTRLGAAARRFARPAAARLRDQVLAEVGPQLDAAREESARARAETEAVRRDLEAEIELLRARLDG